MKIGIYHLVSDIHDKDFIDKSLKPFIDSIENYLGESMMNLSPAELKKEPILPVIMIKSGGVEEKFKRIYQQFPSPYFILAGCLHNALPAAL